MGLPLATLIASPVWLRQQAGSSLAQDVECVPCLFDETGGHVHDVATRMSVPGVENSIIDASRLGGGFNANRILVIVPVLLVGHAQVNHGVVTSKGFTTIGSNGLP